MPFPPKVFTAQNVLRPRATLTLGFKPLKISHIIRQKTSCIVSQLNYFLTKTDETIGTFFLKNLRVHEKKNISRQCNSRQKVTSQALSAEPNASLLGEGTTYLQMVQAKQLG